MTEAVGKPHEGPSYLWRHVGGALFLAAAAIVIAGTYFFMDSRADATSVKTDAMAASDNVANLPQTRGPSGLMLPRFVSLKSNKVRVRRGPSSEHQVAWVYTAKGLPVEIVAEFEHWRRIRDADGEEGWVRQSLLSGWRTAMVAPWSKEKTYKLLEDPNGKGDAVAIVRGGVIGRILRCDGNWCRLRVGDYEGWIQQAVLWGVYPGEHYPKSKVN